MNFFNDYQDHLTHIKKYSLATVEAYINDIGQFYSYCMVEYDCKDWSLVTHHMIRSWVVSLNGEGVSPRSIKRKLSSLSGYFKFLLKRKVIDSNPMSKVIAPKVGKSLPQFATEKEMENHRQKTIINTDSFKHQRNTFIIELLYHTGMRRSELINLMTQDVNLPRKEIRVIGKGKKERIIPMNDKLIKAFHIYLEHRKVEFDDINTDYLVLSDKGHQINPKSLYNIVKSYLTVITNAEKKSPHTLRHSFATHLLNAGADINAIKEILGHANLSATEVYTHVSIDRLKNVYKDAHPKA